MKHIRNILILGGVLMLIVGCATCPKKDCPLQDTIIRVAPFQVPVLIPKGLLNEENKDKKWMDREDFEKIVKEKKKDFY